MAQLELKLGLDNRSHKLSFIDGDTLFAYSHNAVLFMKVESGEISVFRPTSLRNVDVAAVHTGNHLFALAERGLNPKLQIFNYPDCKLTSTIEGAAKFEYMQLAFSNSVYLAAFAGVPEFKLSIWDVISGNKLVEANYDLDVRPACIFFNPGNWHQLGIVSADEGRLSLWTIEQSSKSYIMRRNNIQLPFEDENITVVNQSEEYSGRTDQGVTVGEAVADTVVRQPESQSVELTNTQKMNLIEIPRFAMAELVEEFAEEFENEPFDRKRLTATSATFNGNNDILVTCKSGHLLTVSFALTYDLSDNRSGTFLSRLGSQAKFSYKCMSILQPSPLGIDSDRAETAEGVWHPKPGQLSQALVHNIGMICMGQESGIVRVVSNDQPHNLVCELDTGGAGLIAACLSRNYEHLALLTSTNSVLVLPAFSLYTHSKENSDESISKPGSVFTVKEIPGVNPFAESAKQISPFLKPWNASFHFGEGQAVGVEPLGMEMTIVVVLTNRGCIQVWNIGPSIHQVGAIFLPDKEDGTKVEWSVLATCPAYNVAFAGTLTGEVYIVDLHKPSSPRLLDIVRLSRRAIVALKFDPFAHVLVAIAADNYMFLIDPRAAKAFQVIGFTLLPGEPVVTAISVFSTPGPPDGKVTVAIGYKPHPNESGHGKQAHHQQQLDRNNFTKVVLFLLDVAKLKHVSNDLYIHPLRRDFKEAALGKILTTLAVPGTALVLVDHHRLCTLNGNNGRLSNYSISTLISSTMADEAATASNEVLQPVDYGTSAAETAMPTVSGIARTLDAKWLLLVGVDGRVIVVSSDDHSKIQATSVCPLVDPRFGGLKSTSLVASATNSFVMAVGQQGSATFMQFGYLRNSSGKVSRDAERSAPTSGWGLGIEECRQWYEDWRAHCRDMLNRETRVLESMPVYLRKEKVDEDVDDVEVIKTDSPHGPTVYEVQPIRLPHDATVIETFTARSVHADDEAIKDKKSGILKSLTRIRERLHVLMTANSSKPDLEKLDHHEFDLDAAEQTRLLQEGDLSAKRLKQQLESEISARLAYIQRIKQECITTMKVKSKGIRGMTSQLRVNNYPLRERTREEIATLEMIKKIRDIELHEFKGRATEKAATDEAETEQAPAAEDAEARVALDSGGQNDNSLDGPADVSEDIVPPVSKEEAMHQQGSFGSQFGADCALHYDQFALQTRDQKLMEIALTKESIYSIKETFNKAFEEACRRKENEMNKINDRNRRLRQIQDLLEVFDKRPLGSDLVQYEPHPVTSEDTEQLFNVRDDEVPAEKWISPADRKKMEEAAKAERERLIRERGDNPRERGLQEMMGGVLEVKKEDELRKEVATPAFISEGKAEADWSEDEVKIAQEFRKRSKELADEREKYRKVVDAEAKKLRLQVSESVSLYEDLLSELFKRKLKTEMAIYQEELKISRLQLELVVEKAFMTQIEELRRRLDGKRSLLLQSQKSVADARKLLSETQEVYDVLLAEDKILEKGFRREFADVGSQQVDLLVRQFRRRPKGLKTGPQLVQALANIAGAGNPFAERPPTATQQEQVAGQLESALAELDRDTNCPESIDPAVWKRLCDYRRQKIEKEFKIKEQALAQAESQSYLAHRIQDEDMVRQDIEKLSTEVARLDNELERFILNIQVQLIVKQGQVELKKTSSGCPLIPDYSDAVLVHRGVVEHLNTCILQKGAAKISNMERAKKTKRDIVRLEWEHRRLQMEMTDLDQKIHDISHLRLTRQVQEFLSSPDYEGRIQKELSAVEQTLLAQQQYHQKAMDRLKQALAEVDNMQVRREEWNGMCEDEIDNMNLKVSEQRRMVEVTSGEMEVDMARRRRVTAIVNRSRLVEVARAQASEIAVLRQEVERLRLKTFPALVQLD